MKHFTENQMEFLLTFFENNKYPGSKEIGAKLIKKGRCIVAGNTMLWQGGIGNFIKTKETDEAVGCLEYTMDINEFIHSELFKESLNYKINKVNSNIIELQEVKEDMEEFRK